MIASTLKQQLRRSSAVGGAVAGMVSVGFLACASEPDLREEPNSAAAANTETIHGEVRAQQVDVTERRSLTPEEASQIAADAYIYAYPIVLMDVTREVMTATPRIDPAEMRAPVNTLVSSPTFPKPTQREVVRLNFDTLYSVAWMDLRNEPLVLSVPAIEDRYYVMQLLDAWTNVFAAPGTRTTGEEALQIAVTGPDFQGEVPPGVREVRAPTNTVWLIGRIETGDASDQAEVRNLQSELELMPLSELDSGPWRTVWSSVDTTVDTRTPPPEQVARMGAREFFERFARATEDNPPKAADLPLLERTKLVGVSPGHAFEWERLQPELQAALERGQRLGRDTIRRRGLSSGEVLPSGWDDRETKMGTYGTNYLDRAAIAMFGLGANLPEDAIYPSASHDSDGQKLNGAHRYRIHFDEPPPVKAFWSITLYDDEGRVVENPAGRYALRDRDDLHMNADGSFDLIVQNAQPNSVNQRKNWLPAPRDDFNLLLRLYWPKEEVVSGQWQPPAIERLE